MKKLCLALSALVTLTCCAMLLVGCAPRARAYVEIQTENAAFFLATDGKRALGCSGDDTGKYLMRGLGRGFSLEALAKLLEKDSPTLKVFPDGKVAKNIIKQFAKAARVVEPLSGEQFRAAISRFCYAPDQAADEKELLRQAARILAVTEKFDTAETDAAFIYFAATDCAVLCARSLFSDGPSAEQSATLAQRARERTDLLMRNALTVAQEATPADEALPVLIALLDASDKKELKKLNKLRAEFDAEKSAEAFEERYADTLTELHRRANPNDTQNER